jgi:outer membrane lipopolysaccharide assembly protein LptE/RlpB
MKGCNIDCQTGKKMEKYSMKSRQILKTFLVSSILVFLTGCYADLHNADKAMQSQIKDMQSEISSGQDSAEEAARAAQAAADAASEAAAKAEAAAEASEVKAEEAERMFERDLGKK